MAILPRFVLPGDLRTNKYVPTEADTFWLRLPWQAVAGESQILGITVDPTVVKMPATPEATVLRLLIPLLEDVDEPKVA